MKIAVASDDGIKLVNRHFGDAKRYYIYDLNKSMTRVIEVIENPMKDYEEKEEDFKGDEKKAKGIGFTLKEKGVTGILGHKIGPNIVNIRKKFVVLISRCIKVDEALQLLRDNYTKIEEESLKNGEKEYFILKK